MREQFEKLPDINKAIKIAKAIGCKVNFEADSYVGDEDRLIDYLNGAWYAYQEQQKKIDKAIEYLDSIEGMVWYEQMKELLK